MHVRLEDVGDAQAVLARQAHVRLDIAGRIDDGATAGGFVSDHVGVDGKAWNEAAVQEHGGNPLAFVLMASARAALGRAWECE